MDFRWSGHLRYRIKEGKRLLLIEESGVSGSPKLLVDEVVEVEKDVIKNEVQ